MDVNREIGHPTATEYNGGSQLPTPTVSCEWLNLALRSSTRLVPCRPLHQAQAWGRVGPFLCVATGLPLMTPPIQVCATAPRRSPGVRVMYAWVENHQCLLSFCTALFSNTKVNMSFLLPLNWTIYICSIGAFHNPRSTHSTSLPSLVIPGDKTKYLNENYEIHALFHCPVCHTLA